MFQITTIYNNIYQKIFTFFPSTGYAVSIVGVIEQNELIAIYFWDKHIEYNEKKFLGYANKADIQKMLLKACRKLFRQTPLSGISCDKLIGLRKFFNELKDIQLLDNHG